MIEPTLKAGITVQLYIRSGKLTYGGGNWFWYRPDTASQFIWNADNDYFMQQGWRNGVMEQFAKFTITKYH